MDGTRTGGFHHVGLVSADLARSHAFYTDVLGLAVASTQPAADGVLWVGDEAGTPGSLLRIAEASSAPAGRTGAGGVHHVALSVSDADAQLRWKRWLQDHGVRVSGPFNRGWFRSIYFADPDGQILEIATRGPGYAVDEDPRELGAQVMPPPTAELRGARDEAEIRARGWPDAIDRIDPAMRLDGIHHISGITYDVADMGVWYEAVLGLRLVKRTVNQDDASMPHWFWANYDGAVVAERSALTMFGPWPAGGYPAAGRMKAAAAGVGITSHIAFRAGDSAELGMWEERLATLGVETSPAAERDGRRTLALAAPDGMRMELTAED